MTKIPLVTCDLDSTFCDTGHRHGIIDRINGTDWDAYSKACVNDTVVLATLSMLRIYQQAGAEIHFVTGRTESARSETQTWLGEFFPNYAGLWMDDTPGGDHFAVYGGHAEYKVARVQHVAEAAGRPVDLHIDDWAEVKAALEEVGIPCLCVRTPQEIIILTTDTEGIKELR